MGRQVTFFAAPDDIAQLQHRIGDIEPMCILHDRSPTAKPRVLPTLDVAEDGQSLLFYFLVREIDLAQVVTRHVPAQGYWTVDVLRSPVVEFDGCFFDGTVLRRGHVYYVEGFYGENDEWIEKPEGFRSWAKRVLKATKKCLKRRGSDYIGAAAAEWLAQGDGKLVT
ncbi:hypothetical protein [Sorangium sp. So ce513]|uniref:hypothetical protein n=1 Tax=Sorangium sp. So ce513 TaxID=3133315 RepID=UPI003F6144D1